MELKDRLPLPVTKEDNTFLANLLRAVKEKRREATSRTGDPRGKQQPNSRKETRDGRTQDPRHVQQSYIPGEGNSKVE